MESPSAQIVDSFDAPVRCRRPGDDDRHRDPDGEFHQQTVGSRPMPRWGKKNPGGQDDEHGRRKATPIQMDAEFGLGGGERSEERRVGKEGRWGWGGGK